MIFMAKVITMTYVMTTTIIDDQDGDCDHMTIRLLQSMAFNVGDMTQTYQENCLNTDESHVCCHFLLEEFGVPENDTE